MQQLAGRLTALDPDASEALRVIPYFEELVSKRAGLESVVRGAAVLSGATARLMTPRRGVPLRVLPDGRRLDHDSEPDPSWQSETIASRSITMWLERPGPSGPVDAMVLERATQAVQTVLDRTRGRHVDAGVHDYEMLELLLDKEAPETARLRAAKALGLEATQVVRVVVEADSRPRVVRVRSDGSLDGAGLAERAGVGPPATVDEVAATVQDAQLAFRLTAEGTPSDPGSTMVLADELGTVMLLAAGFDEHPEWAQHPDVAALDRATRQSPGLLGTLTALCATDSLRAAAGVLVVHHSTLQKRLGQVEKLVGWDVMSPAGKLRLQMALVLRRLELTRT